MKKYNKTLLYCFLFIACLLFIAIIAVEIHSEHNYKRAILQSRLDSYADMIDVAGDFGRVRGFLPADLRVTVMTPSGQVFFDSQKTSAALDNHLQRPEVADCLEHGSGYASRYSSTDGARYLYYAKMFDDKIVRVALPFEVNARQYFHPDWLALITISSLFAVTVVVILVIFVFYDRKKNSEQKRKIRVLKQQMTGNISHELKTPVSSIRGYLETVINTPGLDPAKRDAFVRQSYLQSVRLSELIRDISLVNKLEEVPEQFPLEQLDLHQIADEIADEFAGVLARNDQRFENRLPSPMPYHGNRALIYAVLRNLMENSVKHAGNGTLLCIEPTESNAKFLRFVYYDTGCGVPPESLDRIFDRFYRAKSTRGQENDGSGLGLSIVRNAVNFHKGTVRAHNREQGGLAFTVSLSNNLN